MHIDDFAMMPLPGMIRQDATKLSKNTPCHSVGTCLGQFDPGSVYDEMALAFKDEVFDENRPEDRASIKKKLTKFAVL